MPGRREWDPSPGGLGARACAPPLTGSPRSRSHREAAGRGSWEPGHREPRRCRFSTLSFLARSSAGLPGHLFWLSPVSGLGRNGRLRGEWSRWALSPLVVLAVLLAPRQDHPSVGLAELSQKLAAPVPGSRSAAPSLCPLLAPAPWELNRQASCLPGMGLLRRPGLRVSREAWDAKGPREPQLGEEVGRAEGVWLGSLDTTCLGSRGPRG